VCGLSEAVQEDVVVDPCREQQSVELDVGAVVGVGARDDIVGYDSLATTILMG
jgi:hypothetical protein